MIWVSERAYVSVNLTWPSEDHLLCVWSFISSEFALYRYVSQHVIALTGQSYQVCTENIEATQGKGFFCLSFYKTYSI